MKNPNIKTKIVHSKSKNAWNVIGISLGRKYKIARLPYIVVDGYSLITKMNKSEAREHAVFINFCFNNIDPNKFCIPGKLCDPENYFATVEMCKTCKTTL